MILIPSSARVEFAAGGLGLLGTDSADNSRSEQGRLRPIAEILPDVLARYGIAAEPPASTVPRAAGSRS